MAEVYDEKRNNAKKDRKLVISKLFKKNMLLSIFFFLVSFVAIVLTSFLPAGDVLPYNLDPLVLNAVTYYNLFAEIFWPLQIVMQAFIYYLGFLIAMKLMKLILGHRAPVTD